MYGEEEEDGRVEAQHRKKEEEEWRTKERSKLMLREEKGKKSDSRMQLNVAAPFMLAFPHNSIPPLPPPHTHTHAYAHPVD